MLLEVLGKLWHETTYSNGNTIIFIKCRNEVLINYESTAEMKHWWNIPKSCCAERCCKRSAHLSWSIVLCDSNQKYSTRFQHTHFPALILTQTWQCDISFIDPTSPGVTSAHTGSAPCWGTFTGTGSTHSRVRVNVFIHLTDCRNGAIQLQILS